jgi:hypothetical protein
MRQSAANKSKNRCLYGLWLDKQIQILGENFMQNIINILNLKRYIVLFGVLAFALAAVSVARASSSDIQSPELPPECGSIQVGAGNEVAFHAYAIGVQIYRWNGTSWALVSPDAKLYADAGYNGKVGFHYGGPTWESNSGSRVVAARVPGTGCTPDANAIPWLLLKKVSTDGPGIFSRVTFIQRVNTTGGVAPTAPGMTVGEEKRVPYTAEYYFYRAQAEEN